MDADLAGGARPGALRRFLESDLFWSFRRSPVTVAAIPQPMPHYAQVVRIIGPSPSGEGLGLGLSGGYYMPHPQPLP